MGRIRTRRCRRRWYPKDYVTRFWSMVDKRGPNDCWEWLGRLGYNNPNDDIQSYGTFYHPGLKRSLGSHRMAWLLAGNGLPVFDVHDPETLVLRHKVCGWRRCVNVNHLALGTRAENAEDARRHGTMPMGQDHGTSSLTDEDVLTIRRRAAAGERQRDISRDYPVVNATVCSIINRRQWKHLPIEEDGKPPARASLGDLHYGANHFKATLSEDQVHAARARYDEGEAINVIARDMGVLDTTMLHVVHRRSWKRLPEMGGRTTVVKGKGGRVVKRWTPGESGHHPVRRPHAWTNLDERDVRDIRRRVAAGETQTAVAKDYQMTQSGVHLIVHRKNWAHVP